MFEFIAGLRFCKGHIKRNSGDNGLPSVIFGESAAFDRAPKIDYFLFGYTFEEILIALPVEYPNLICSHHCFCPTLLKKDGVLSTQFRCHIGKLLKSQEIDFSVELK